MMMLLMVRRGGGALGVYLIDMIRDAIDLPGRILNGLGRVIGRHGRSLRGFHCRIRRSFGAFRGLLGLLGRGFGLLGLNLLTRRPARRER